LLEAKLEMGSLTTSRIESVPASVLTSAGSAANTPKTHLMLKDYYKYIGGGHHNEGVLVKSDCDGWPFGKANSEAAPGRFGEARGGRG
jgi:hypothetical protein